MKILKKNFWFLCGTLFLAGCNSDKIQQQTPRAMFYPSNENAMSPSRLTIIPNAIPGTPRSSNNENTGGYAPSSVQAQLKINVKENTNLVRVTRDNADPYVITKPYILKHADPFAVRSYLEAAVGARSVTSSPAEATAVQYEDGTGIILVSAEAYRFKDSKDGRGIDRIIEALDRKDLKYLPEADAHIYFPRISRAFNLKDMIEKVGSYAEDPQFAVAPVSMVVDAELNALIVKAPKWNWLTMLQLLKKYDRPIPEIKIVYRVIEIYAENDDRIGIDFQSWKNNDGVDLFSTGMVSTRNWGTFFTSGVQPTGRNSAEYWNFNPKWNTRYLDFLTSIGKARCLTQGVIVAQNRRPSSIQVNSGFFYDRTSYPAGATTMAEITDEFAYTEVNPDTIKRESMSKIMPAQILQNMYNDMGTYTYIVPSGYTMRVMGTQTSTNTYADASSQVPSATKIAYYMAKGYTEAQATALASTISPISQYLTGYVKEDGTVVGGNYYNTDWDTVNASPGIIHGGIQFPMVTDGFKFEMNVTPVITKEAAKIRLDLSSISLLGWNSDGSARRSTSSISTTFQIGSKAREFVVGGLRKSESVRGTAGLPFFKDLPVIGRIFSTETESIKQSQLVLLARIDPSLPETTLEDALAADIDDIVNGVNKGMTSRMGNMFFQQYFLDTDRSDRLDRLDRVGNIINDDYREIK